MSNQNSNLTAVVAARETQLTKSINAEYQALVSLEETKAALSEARLKVAELTKQNEIRNNQLEALKSEYNVIAIKASAFGWFIENLSQEIPDIPNTTIDSHVTSRIIEQYQNHKTGEKHLANISLVNFAYGIHEPLPEPTEESTPTEESIPTEESTPTEEVKELTTGLNKKPSIDKTVKIKQKTK